MDRSRLNSLKRSQLQQLARRENLKANAKNVEIIRLLLKKYPDGVPESTNKPSVPKSPTTALSKAKQPVRRSKRKSVAKSGSLSIKTEEVAPNVHVEPTLDKPSNGRDVRSMAPPPITPAASMYLRPSIYRRLPTTPPIDSVFETQAEGEADKIAGDHNMVRQSEATPSPPEAAAATSHQVNEMLRSLTDIIDAASLNPKEPSSILYRANALNAVLDAAIIPRMMKVDKDIKDMVWLRTVMENNLGSRPAEDGVLLGSRDCEVLNVRPGLSFPAPRPPPSKRSREEGSDEEGSPPPGTSKRTRIR